MVLYMSSSGLCCVQQKLEYHLLCHHLISSEFCCYRVPALSFELTCISPPPLFQNSSSCPTLKSSPRLPWPAPGVWRPLRACSTAEDTQTTCSRWGAARAGGLATRGQSCPGRGRYALRCLGLLGAGNVHAYRGVSHTSLAFASLPLFNQFTLLCLLSTDYHKGAACVLFVCICAYVDV